MIGTELTRDIEAAITDGVKPSDERVQKLAARWRGLVEEFTVGDKEIQAGLNKMYSDEKNWQTNWKKPYSDEVQNFIVEAMKSHTRTPRHRDFKVFYFLCVSLFL